MRPTFGRIIAGCTMRFRFSRPVCSTEDAAFTCGKICCSRPTACASREAGTVVISIPRRSPLGVTMLPFTRAA